MFENRLSRQTGWIQRTQKWSLEACTRLKEAKTLPAVLGGGLYAFGLNAILISNEMSEGGFAGLSTLLHFLFGTSVGLMYFAVNLPLLVLGARFMGLSFLWKTVAGIGIVTLSLMAFEPIHLPFASKLMAVIAAGCCSGLGRGLMFRSGYTTGGVDIVSFVLHKFTGFPKAYSIMAFDLIVMGLFAVFISPVTALYSMGALFIGSQILHRATGNPSRHSREGSGAAEQAA